MAVAAEQADEEEKREIDEPIVLTLSEDWKTENAVLCVASRNALDETVALALARLLEKFGIGAKVIDPERLRHGNLSAADIDGARLICISTLDARERDAHARFLARRLKRAAPDATVLGGFWKLDAKADASIIAGIQVDATATTLREAVRFCVGRSTRRQRRKHGRASRVDAYRYDCDALRRLARRTEHAWPDGDQRLSNLLGAIVRAADTAAFPAWPSRRHVLHRGAASSISRSSCA